MIPASAWKSSQLICADLDSLDGKPRFHNASHASDWAYLRFEFAARSMCDGIAVWGRKIARPEGTLRAFADYSCP